MLQFDWRRLGLGLVTAAGMFAVSQGAQAAGTGLASIHDLRVERGKLCMAGHFHHGFGSGQASKRAAFVEAVKGWQSFTRLEYGNDWANIRLAASKSRSCSRSKRGWKCHVKARPCRRR